MAQGGFLATDIDADLAAAIGCIEEASKDLRPLPLSLAKDNPPSQDGQKPCEADQPMEKRLAAVLPDGEVKTALLKLCSAVSAEDYFAELAAEPDLVPGWDAVPEGDAPDHFWEHPSADGEGTVAVHKMRLRKWAAKVNYWINQSHAVREDIEVLHAKLGRLVEVSEAVKQKSTFLSSHASSLITQNEQCQRLCEGIDSRLQYFSKVDILSNEVNNPHLDPTGKRFREMLREIDSTMHFLTSHWHYKSSSQYFSRMKITQQRAMIALRDAVISAITNVTSAISRDPRFTAIVARTTKSSGWQALIRSSTMPARTKDILAQAGECVPDSNDETPEGQLAGSNSTTEQINASGTIPPGNFGLGSVLNVEFRGRLHPTMHLLECLEERCTSPDSQVYMQDVMSTYTQSRLQLLLPIFTDYLTPHSRKAQEEALEGGGEALSDMVAHGTTYLLALSADETELFHHLWRADQLTEHLGTIVESVAMVLYDAFRSTVLREDELDRLCSIIHSLSNPLISKVKASGEAGQLLSCTINRMIQDAQERLIFRASMYIKDVISPCHATVTSCIQYTQAGQKADEATAKPTPGGPGHEAPNDLRKRNSQYFPTLQQTLNLLSSLYNTVDKGVFAVMAQEAIRACCQNLTQVAQYIRAIPPNVLAHRDLDARLFLVRHLLQLREQISPFDVNFQVIEKDVDLSNIRYSEISVAATQHDTKKDLENRLKQECELFISNSSHFITFTMVQFTKLLKSRMADPLGSASAKPLQALLQSVLGPLPQKKEKDAGSQPSTPATPGLATQGAPQGPRTPTPPSPTAPAAPPAPATPPNPDQPALDGPPPANLASPHPPTSPPEANNGETSAPPRNGTSSPPAVQQDGKGKPKQDVAQERVTQAEEEYRLVHQRLQQGMTALLSKMTFYISNQFTMDILLKPIKGCVIQAYQEMYHTLEAFITALVQAGGLPESTKVEFLAEVWTPNMVIQWLPGGAGQVVHQTPPPHDHPVIPSQAVSLREAE